MSRNLAARGFTFACCVVLAWAEVASVAGAQDFVRRDGTSFVVGGEPFRFVGANAAVMHGPVARAHYLETLDAVAADGLRVVRIWAFGETAADAPPWQNDYAFRRGPQGYVETSFEHLDRVLGGAREHLRWCGVTLPDDDADGATLADYWSNVAGRTLYWEHVARVVGRTNTVSHVAYRDDPTIFAWELINESAANTTVAADALVAWTDATARFIRERDANHMIAAGHIGYRTSRQREVWARVQELLSIDYSDAHGYPEEDPRVDSRRALDRYVDDRLLVALSRAQREGAKGVLAISSDFVMAHAGLLRQLMRQQRLPLMESFPSGAGDAGGLVGYGPDLDGCDRQLVRLLLRVIDGADPGSLPIEQPTQIRLSLNLRMARELGVAIPRPLQLRADTLLE